MVSDVDSACRELTSVVSGDKFARDSEFSSTLFKVPMTRYNKPNIFLGTQLDAIILNSLIKSLNSNLVCNLHAGAVRVRLVNDSLDLLANEFLVSRAQDVSGESAHDFVVGVEVGSPIVATDA